MLKVTYQMLHIKSGTILTNRAYFDTYQSALITITRWQNEHWRYYPISVKQEDGNLHPDCLSYKHKEWPI